VNLHEAWSATVDERVAAEPGAFAIYVDLRRHMTAGKFEPYVDIVTQHERGGYDLYDAYTFGQVHAHIATGEIHVKRIDLGSMPSADAASEINNSKLSKLPAPFKARFRGGNGDCDGTLEWGATFQTGDVRWEPHSSVPLEVGLTRPATTWRHLCGERFLARWPYGHTSIWLLWWPRKVR